MRPRRVEQDQVEPAVDDRADDAAAAPQLVAVEMLVIELEAVGAEERPRLQRQRAGNRPRRPAPGRGSRASPRFRAGSCWNGTAAPAGLAASALADQALPFLRPVTKLMPSSSGPFSVQSSTWRMSSKKIGRWRFHGRGGDDRHAAVADPDALDADQRIVAVAVIAAAEAEQAGSASAPRARRWIKFLHARRLLTRPSAAPRRRPARRASSSDSGRKPPSPRRRGPAFISADAVPAPRVRRRVRIDDRGGIALRRRAARRRRGCAAARPRLRKSAAGRSSRPAPASRSDTGWRRDR